MNNAIITPEQHLERFRRRRNHADFTAIFMGGCCFHFALTLNEKFKYALEYLPSEPYGDPVPVPAVLPGIGHCWALKQAGLGIDINGVHPTTLLGEFYRRKNLIVPIAIEPLQLQACLKARNYPKELNDEAFALAREIIETHERFQDALPLDLGWENHAADIARSGDAAS